MAIEKRTGSKLPRLASGKLAKDNRVVRFVDLNDSLNKIEEYTEGNFIPLPENPSNGDALVYNSTTGLWEASETLAIIEKEEAYISITNNPAGNEVLQSTFKDDLGEDATISIAVPQAGTVELTIEGKELTGLNIGRLITLTTLTRNVNSMVDITPTIIVQNGDTTVSLEITDSVGATNATFHVKLEYIIP